MTTNTRMDTPHSKRPVFAITGASGLVGTALRRQLDQDGAQVLRLVRRPPAASDEVQWNPKASFSPDQRLEGVDAVIHLAGAGIADRRWTAARREMLLRSRVDGTRFLVEALQQLNAPPATFVQASAIGWYGNRGDEILSEGATRGTGFLAGLAYAWEQAGEPIERVGARRVSLRMGMVVSDSGGALARMKPVFRCGLGGRLGNGRQWVSWIALADLVDIILRSCRDATLSGPVNAVSPYPVTNRIFTKALAHAWRRPAVLPAPSWALQLMLGGMASELLLSSQRCIPGILEELGHRFAKSSLPEALKPAPSLILPLL